MKDIYYNAVIYVKKGMYVSAIGVENGRIGAVGDRADMKAWEEEGPAVWHDLEGRFVVPGFVDSHMHLLEYGYSLATVDLASATWSMADVLDRVSGYMADHGESWIVGRGWNHDYFQDEKRFPNRYDLDRVTKGRPAILYRACGHVACVNSAALALAGITGDSPQPEGGCFDTDENGEPTGVLREYGINMVSRIIPPPGKEEIKGYILTAMEKLNANGITSVQSDDLEAFSGVSYEEVINAYRELESQGLMTVKVYEQCLLSGMDTLRDFVSRGYRTGAGSRFFTIGPLKVFTDGSLGARTALLSRPYADDAENPDNCGISIYSQEELDEKICFAAEHGLQVAVHAIGDRAMDMTVRAFEKAGTGKEGNRLRHGIVHCQITTKELLKKFQELDLHAYVQSIFLDYDNHIVEDRLGKERAGETYQFKTLLDMGVEVSNGSDAPVENPDVLAGIQCAVTRTTLDGSKAFLPDQALSVEEALETYLSLGARASFEENEKGMLLPGMTADFTVLAEDLRYCRPERIKDVEVCRTFVDGICVFNGVGGLKRR
ncbi:MAG: amidohydrolase [Lacrimispora sp.]|uniref:amidohydrolase n=1 Tax=Lacrimispora sp. TaxID=2719234 RepID=UPI0039E3C6C0